MTVYGVHTGLQHTTIDELVELWQRIEAAGYGWISIWDHFYAADMTGDADCMEAVAAHAALARETSRVTCGSLVYCVGYRHPAVLAKAITTIDHLSGGRAAVGLGAGWSELEYEAYGIPFPPVGTRMDQLKEGIQVLRGMLHDEVTNLDGKWFRLKDARNEPRPVQERVPVWVGGGGEKRTLRIAARYADAWNVPFVSPEEFAHKRSVLHQHCEDVGRDPSSIRTAVNLGLAWSEDDVEPQFGLIRMRIDPGLLKGWNGDEWVLDRIGQYVEAGADQVNIAVRSVHPPQRGGGHWDPEGLERLAAALQLS